MIVMDSKAQLTVDIIAKVVEGRITIVNAAKLLSKSRRTIERYVKQYQQVGIQFAIHGNSGKAPLNKTPESIKKAVQVLIKEGKINTKRVGTGSGQPFIPSDQIETLLGD